MVRITKKFQKILKLAFFLVTLVPILIIGIELLGGDDFSIINFDVYIPNIINKLSLDSSIMETKISIDQNSTREFFDKVFNIITDNSPDRKSRRHYKDGCKIKGGISSTNDNIPRFPELSFNSMKGCLDFTSEELESLTVSHSGFVESLETLSPPSHLYSGDGIVTVGGGKFSLISFLSIKHLRELGTTYPIEVFIPPSTKDHKEYKEEEQFCKELLPKYNAKCIFIDRILSADMINKFEFKGYQFKILAIAASSFENVLFLDSDNTSVKKLEKIFESQPFEKYGMILWPDYWRRSTTPYYYQVAGIPINTKKRIRNSYDDITPPEVYTKHLDDLDDIPLHDMEGTIPDVSTESGQLLINKKKHLNTLLLSLYYNINGPTWYYPMLTQKAPGEGDKDTFVAAAIFYKLPFYQVKSRVVANGYGREGKFHGVAMHQHDFMEDYRLYELAKDDIKQKYSKPENVKYDPDYNTDDFAEKYWGNIEYRETMFIHSNFPKFEPIDFWKSSKGMDTNTGEQYRLYENFRRLKGFDLELSHMQTIHNLFCHRNKSGDLSRAGYFSYINETLDNDPSSWEGMCKYLSVRVKFLESTHEKVLKQ